MPRDGGAILRIPPRALGQEDPATAALLSLYPQVSPGSVHLMKVVEDFIHLVGGALKAFQSSLIVTDNLGECPGPACCTPWGVSGQTGEAWG